MSSGPNERARGRARAQVDRLIGPVRAKTLLGGAQRAAVLTRRGVSEARAVQAMRQAGMIGLGPAETTAELRALRIHGQLGAPQILAALRHGERTGLIDEQGSLTFAEMNERSDHLAAALARRGITDSGCMAILCRNHRGFIDATFAATKLGMRVLLLNADLSAAELEDLGRREEIDLLIHDEEFTSRLGAMALTRGRILAWRETSADGQESLEDLIRAGADLPTVGMPPRHARVVLFTSGANRPPRGVARSASPSLAPAGAMLSKLPYRAGEATCIAAPMSHGVGYSQMLLSMSLGCTLITERHFDAGGVLGAVTAHRPSALVVVPVMLGRILGTLDRGLNRFDLSSLRVVLVSGSPLGAELVRRAQVSLGSVLYNFYGTTEAAYIAFATPEDLRQAPGSVGYPPRGTVVRLLDDRDRWVSRADRVGRIFVANSFTAEGHVGGGAPVVREGMLATGDLGHFDAGGRLWVDGREDEVLLGSPPTLFPAEIEGILAEHPHIREAAVIGVEAASGGRRPVAFVVPHAGSRLDPESVRSFVRSRLGSGREPQDVHFLAELPLSSAGTVLKRELHALHAQLGEDPPAAG